MSQFIWDSLPFTDRLQLSPAAPYSTFGAIGSLGWGLNQHLSTLYGVVSSGGILIWIFFAFGNALVLTYIYIAIDPPKINGFPSQYLRWILIGFLVLIPMFLVGSDWGRWIASISNQLILLMFTLHQSSMFFKPDMKPISMRFGLFGRLRRRAFLFLLCVSYGFIFQMPECCADPRTIFAPYMRYLSF